VSDGSPIRQADAGPDILLIEDSPSQALQLQLILQRAGYRVTVVADGAAGWRAACDQPPRLILLDVELPTLDGFQVLSRLKRGRETAAIPVIMLTNRDHVSSVERAIELGVDGYLPKQDMLHQLCTIVRQFLDAQV
jgi:DNA-binding response OmpR family regulator